MLSALRCERISDIYLVFAQMLCLVIVGQFPVVNLLKCTSRLTTYQRHSWRLGYMITRLAAFVRPMTNNLISAFEISLDNVEFIVIVVVGIVIIP